MNLLIRPYQKEDKQTLLSILKLNVPTYFAQEEIEDLSVYLDQHIDLYFVGLLDNVIVGAAGINRKYDLQLGSLSWGFLHPDYHRRGIGEKLLKHRVNILLEDPKINDIRVRTSQVVYRFFEKHNFKVIDIVKDYWGKGLDLYEMQYTNNNHK